MENLKPNTLRIVVFFCIFFQLTTNTFTANPSIASTQKNTKTSLDYYWVGGSGNWSDYENHWATTPGGTTFHTQPPTGDDNVYFDANSFPEPGAVVNVDQNAFCADMDWTGALNNPTISDNWGVSLTIHGSITLTGEMAFNVSRNVIFLSSSTGNTITSAGQSFNCDVYFRGGGGSWVLQDEFLHTGSNVVYLEHGILDFNNHDVSVTRFNTDYTNVRTLLLGDGTFTITSSHSSAFRFRGENLTFNAGNSTVVFTGSGPGLNHVSDLGNGIGFNIVVFENTDSGSSVSNHNGSFNQLTFHGNSSVSGPNIIAELIFYANGTISSNNNEITSLICHGSLTINDSGSYEHVVMNGNGSITGNNIIGTLELSAGNAYTFSAGRNQVITNDLVAYGTCASQITIRSSSPGSQSSISKSSGTVEIEYCVMSDINASGGAAFVAGNTIDMGNNTGWTINEPDPVDLYWVGGTGSWNDPENWAFSSGGEGGTCVPSPIDNVFFDMNSFDAPGQSVHMPGDGNDEIHFKSMNWAGVTNNPTLTGNPDATLRIHGSLTLSPGMTYDFPGRIYFVSVTGGNTIFTAGNPLNKNNLYFNGEGGEWILQDVLNIGSQTLYLVRGTLNTNDQQVEAGILHSNYSDNERTLILGSSEITLSATSNLTIRFHGTNMSLDAGTSLIRFTGSGTGINNLGEGLFFHDVVFESTSSSTVNVYNRGGGFNNVIFHGTGTNGLRLGNTVDSVYFAGNASISGDNNNINIAVFNGDASISGSNSVYNDLHIPGEASLSGNSTYGEVVIAGDASIGNDSSFEKLSLLADASITGNNTIGVLEFTAGNRYTLRNDRTQTILEDFIANGTESELIIIRSSSTGNQTTIFKESDTVTLDYVSLQDNNAEGGAEFIAINSFDMGNNTGWTINTPPGRDLYWVGGSGYWNDMENWSLSSGGDGGAGLPTQNDNVFFDENSFAEPEQTVTLVGDASDNVFCMNMDWTGVMHNPTIEGSSDYHLRIHGSLTLVEDMNYQFGGRVYFQSEEEGNTITTAGVPLNNDHMYFNGEGGEWILQDALNIGSETLYLVRGTLNTNDQQVEAGILHSNYSDNERTLILGSSEITLSSTSNLTIRFHGTNMNLDAGTSLIRFTGSGTGINNLGEGLFFHDIVFESTSSITVNVYNRDGGFNNVIFQGTGTNGLRNGNTVDSVYFAGNAFISGDNNNINLAVFNGNASISGSNSVYNDLHIPGEASLSGNSTYGEVVIAGDASIGNDSSFDKLSLLGDASITGNNTIGVLEFTAGNRYTLRNDRTQTILEDFIANGTESELIIIRSSSTGSQTTIFKENGTVTLDYVSLQDNNAEGGAEFVANNSFDMGNNSGWTINTPPGRDLHWVGGSGYWNDMENWSLSSGGDGGAGVPLVVDNVFFDENSFSEPEQTVTLVGDASDNVYLVNMDWTGATHSPILAGSSDYHLIILGSLTLVENMSYEFGGRVYFQSEEEGNTITTAGVPLNNDHMYFNGEGGEWILQDALNIGSRTLYLVRGTLNTNDQQVEAGILHSNYSDNERTLILGSSEITLSATSNLTIRFHGTNMNLDAGTSLIRFTGSGTGVNNLGEGLFFHDVVFESTSSSTVNVYNSDGGFNNVVFHGTGTNGLRNGNTVDSVYFAGNAFISGDNNNINIAVFNGNASIGGNGNYGEIIMMSDGSITGNNTIGTLKLTPGYTYTFTNGRTQTIVDDFIANGTCYAPIIIQSSSTTSQTTLHKDDGDVHIHYASLQGINATGEAEFTAENCIDLGNNSGWTFSHVTHNLYWTGGSGDWSDVENWSAESGGEGGYCVPTQLDNVIFDQNSFTQNGQAVYINVDNARCNDMDWSMVDFSPTFTSNSSNNNLHVYGSLNLSEDMNFAFPGRVYFRGTPGEEEMQYSINTAGKSFNNHVSFSGEGGTWTLEDDLSTGSNELYLVHGTLVTNNHTLSCHRFLSNYSNARGLELGTSTVRISSGHSSAAWNVGGSNFLLDAGGSEIRLLAGNAGFTSTGSHELSYNNIVFQNPGGTSTLNSNHSFNAITFFPSGEIEGSGSYQTIDFMSEGKIDGENTFEEATFFNDATIRGTNTFGDLHFTPGRSVLLESGMTQTINNEITFIGNAANPISLQATTTGEQATMFKATGIVTGNYLHLKDIHAAGGATFNVYNATDLGNNTGWNFLDPDEATCPETLQACYSDPPFELNMAMPSGGVYSGEGVFFDEDNEIYMFDPSLVENDHAVITYDVVNGVPSSCEFLVEILQLPDIECPDDISVCAESGYITLYEGQGEFMLDGQMITGFDPVSPGTFMVTYIETNVCGSLSCTFEIEVMPLPDISCTEILYVYEEHPPVDLTQLVSPPGGVFTGDYLDAENDGYFFDPSNGIGQYDFEYCVTLGECEDCCQITIHVVEPLSISLSANPEEVCPGADSQITATVTGGSGDYSFTWTSEPAGFHSTEMNPVVNPEINTTYTVVVSDGYDTATASVLVEIWYSEPPAELTNLLPADGAFVSQPVDFSWDASADATAYDLYIWRSTQNKPSQPTVQGITETNYTHTNYLNTAYLYNWQLIALNPCFETPGPVLSFAFSPLPDLTVVEVVVPDTAMAGSEMEVSYTIANIGEGETGWVPWYDHVYLSPHPEFDPETAILAGSFENVSFLDPDEDYCNEVSITLNDDMEGDYYVFVFADAQNIISETNVDNNILRSAEAVEVSMPPYPDLAVSGVGSLSGNIVPGESLTVGWQVENVGDAEAVGGWSQRIAIVSGSQIHILGFAQNTETLDASGSISQSASFMVHQYPGMEGDVYLQVRLTPNPELIEKPGATDNNTALSEESVFMEKRLKVSLPGGHIDEGDPQPMNAMVYRSGNRSQELVIDLGVSEDDRVIMPETITIPPNQAGAGFTVTAIDNDVVEGDVDIEITAAAEGYPGASAWLTIIDNDMPGLDVSLSAHEAWEGDTVQLTVTREFVTADALNVAFFVSNPNQLSMPANIQIPADEPSITIDVAVVDDNIPELTEDVVIEASAPGYDPASATITVYDNDIPGLTFTINPSVVTEDAGAYAAWGKVEIDEPATGNLAVKISVDIHGQVFFPSMISIPHGQTEQQFNIGVIDNEIVDGDRDVVITAAVYIPSCDCGAPPETGGADDHTLTIIDDDGPALSASPSPNAVPENIEDAGILTISRNTPGDNELIIQIEHDNHEVLDLPETATMPQGVTSIEVPFNTLDDGVDAGDHLVTIIVSAEGHSPGTCWLVVADQNLPDFVARGVTLSEDSVLINNELDISLQIVNEGYALAASGAEVKIYMSKSNTIGSASKLIATKYSPSAIEVGDSLKIEATHIPIEAIGTFYIIATVNADNAINELLTINNTSEAVPFSVLPDYTATATVDGDVFNGITPITITGYTEALGKGPAPNKDVDVYLVVSGVRRVMRTVSDENGNFSVDFIPLNGEAGDYHVGACYPGEGLDDAQDEFVILGAKHTVSGHITWDLYLDETKDMFLEIKNNSSMAMHNVSIEVISAPESCELSFSPIAVLPGNGHATISYSVTATDLSPGNNYEKVQLRLTCDEGTRFNFNAWFYSQATKGNMRVSPVVLNKTMVQSQVNFAEFEVRNNGMDETGVITIELPDAEWLSFAGSDTIASLAPGATAVVTLKLTPGPDLQLNNPISGQLTLSATNASSVALPFVFEPVSLATGDLLVDVVDEYTYNTEEAPHVEGATVIVSHPYTGEIIAQGLSNADGHFLAEDLNEGYYNLRVTAPQHNTYQNSIFVEKGIVNTQVVFIDFQAISYSWNVVPTQIPDQYEIDLVVQFETHVPAPVITMDLPETMPDIGEDQVFSFIITLVNHGLIAAKNVFITFPNDPEYEFSTSVDAIDIAAGASRQIPATMRVRDDDDDKRKRLSGHLPCVASVQAHFEFECGPEDRLRLAVSGFEYAGRDCDFIPTEGFSGGSGGGHGGWGTGGSGPPDPGPGMPPSAGGPGFPIKLESSPIQFDNEGCDPCLPELLNAIWGCVPIPDLTGILINKSGIPVVGAVRKVWGRVKCAWNIGQAIGCMINDMAGWSKNRSTFLEYLINLQEDFYKTEDAFEAIETMIHEVYDDALLTSRQDFLLFNDSVYDNLDAFTEIDSLRQQQLLDAFSNSDIPEHQMTAFFNRWNATVEAWNSGIFEPNDDYPNIIDNSVIEELSEPIDQAISRATNRGYESVDKMYAESYDVAYSYVYHLSSSICASVTIQFSQTLTMTREAFEGTLTIFNGHEALPMENINLDLEIRDQDGVLKNNLFEVTTLSLDQISEIDGTGVLEAQKEGSAVVMFIPERGAAPDVPQYYSFGGKLSYLDPFTGTVVEQILYPVTLQVNPSPNLYIDYFMPRNILGNDPFTDVIEPSIPAELAVMIDNRGAGTAFNVSIESAKPNITDNDKGLLIDFDIIGSNLGGQPKQLGLMNVNFGNIEGGETAVGQWWFTSSLLGQFTAFDVSVNHLNSFGNPELSLVSSVNIHELVKSVYVYGEFDDGINDFLVNDIPDLDDTPDALYYSNGIVAPVHPAENAQTDGQVNMNNLSIELTVEPLEPGWNYARMSDPGNGLFRIVSCTREDGQEIPLDNIWLTHVHIPYGGEPVYENRMHFLDIFDDGETYSYTVVFEPVEMDVPAVVAINGVPESVIDYPLTDVQVLFNKPIDPATFNHEDMILTNQAGPNIMDSTVVVTQLNDTLFNVNLASKTYLNGAYALTVHTAGIADLVGNYGQVGKQATWTQALDVPAIVNFVGHPTEPGDAIDEIHVYFNMPIIESTFTNQQLILVNNEGDTLSTESLMVTPQGLLNRLFRITGLLPYNMDPGVYELAVKVTEILGESGHFGVVDQSVHWHIADEYELFVYAGPDDAICEGNIYSLSNAETNAPYYEWTGGDGYFNEEFDQMRYHPGDDDIAAGQVELCLTAVTGDGAAIVTDCMMLTIHSLPDVICPDDMFIEFEDLPLTLTGATPEGGVYTGPDVENNVFNPTGENIFGYRHVQYTYTDEHGCTNNCSFTIRIDTVPPVYLYDMVVQAGEEFCYASSTTILTIDYVVEPGGSVTLLSASNILMQAGTHIHSGAYLHAFIDSDTTYCEQPRSILASEPMHRESELPTDDIPDDALHFIVYPNPTTGIVTLELISSDYATGGTAEIYCMMGELMQRKDLTGKRQWQFDLMGRPKGIYIVRIFYEDGMSVWRLIKH